MLFDLQSTRRRRTTVKIVYGTLALLIAVGLIFLGVGTGGSGPLDANNSNGGGSGNAASNGVGAAKIAAGNKEIKADPTSAKGYSDLALGYYADAQSASGYNQTSELYTASGKASLKKVVDVWNRYAAAVSDVSGNQELTVLAAHAMDATEDFTPAVVVWQDFIKTEPTGVTGYTCLAAVAYASKNKTLGLQALNKAISLTPKLTRTTTETELNELKTASYASKFASESEECS